MARVQFEDYELGPMLGAGTVGTIYRVRDKRSGQIAALKLLSPAVSQDKLVVSRFAREMWILQKLHHPHIITYYGGGKWREQLFYVMEWIQGGTVKTLLARSGPFRWGEAVECGRQVASALQHAHNHGIIHRDLKPGNIFLTLEGQCKLGDFGIARDLHAADLTDSGLTVGTYAYMAPEVVEGRRAISGKVDLYALGCVLCEILAGRPPYVGDHFAQIFEQHLRAQPPRLRDLGVDAPQQLEELIMQLLAKDPEQRPFNAREVQGRLTELCEAAGHCPSQLPAMGRDRPAAAVRLLQESLSQRIMAAVPAHDVSWRTVLWLAAAVAGFVLMAYLLGTWY